MNICNDLENILLNTNQIDDIVVYFKSIPFGSWAGCIGEIASVFFFSSHWKKNTIKILLIFYADSFFY